MGDPLMMDFNFTGIMKKKTMWIAIVPTMMAAIALTGCSSDNSNDILEPVVEEIPSVTPTVPTVPTPPSTTELTRAEQEMVNRSNEFAFNLFRQITGPDGFGDHLDTQSVIISPISITYALGMLNNGAAGTTQQQINEVLGFGEAGADAINDFCYKMSKTAPALDPLTKVLISNTIFLNKNYKLMPDFISKAKVFYDAEPETRDFNDGKTMDAINQWASDHTEQMIQEVLNEESFTPDAISYLLNAIYFKGEWTCKFDKAETVDENFQTALRDDETECLVTNQCPMMHQLSTFNYYETADCQVLQLPYGNQTYNMTILLPKGNTRRLPSVPTAEQWKELNRSVFGVEVDVKLPRFEAYTDLVLNDIMKKLGMPDAFSDITANFSNFCVAPAYISLMKQTAKIKVDEEGTEAAAVTVIGAGEDYNPTPSYVTFHANHPFLYIISEKNTGAIFFIGQYTGR